ncbi:MAG: mechanosensitive ion channel family protein [Rikenellaceae bacterium]|nr:mechanosensitive ion channel family protein [Rikenellaceae bacterium]MDE7355433.1 mechanosensitive ion channel family protein [Rikenellaceae bacterium]
MKEITEKFWFIDDIQNMLIKLGLSYSATNIFTFIIALGIVFLILWLFDLLCKKLLVGVLHNVAHKIQVKTHAKADWADALTSRNFFRRLLRFIQVLIVVIIIEDILKGFSDVMVKGVVTLSQCLVVFFLMVMTGALLDASSDIYMMIPRTHKKSIKSYVQSLKIITYIVGVLLMVSIFMGIKMSTIMVSLATSAAILTLVFKDTILGFVASIQLSSQDMVRPGDWIEMKSKGADGVVIDMSVNTVKVKNWDNTVTMIPIYSMVSEAFVNWRSMEEGDGRRFKRPFTIDLLSVRPVTEAELAALESNPVVGAHYNDIVEHCKNNPDQELNNASLYRAYVSAYLRAHKDVNHHLSLVVHYLPLGDQGLPLEIYGFTYERGFEKHEVIVSRITEHLFNAARVFGLRFFQRSTNMPQTDD